MRSDPEIQLPASVAEHLGHYVYLYVDPRTEEPFYVGKGAGNRVLAHSNDGRESKKTRLIAEIHEQGLSPRLDILAHGLRDEETAFRIEAAAIDLLGLDALTNEVRGWRSLQTGRMTLDELVDFYAAPAVEITHPVLLIRINKLYRRGIPEHALYEATRGIWKLGPRREKAKYALALFHGLVREVYEIHAWHPAGTLTYETRDLSQYDLTGRWEFEGKVAFEAVRSLYLRKAVHAYLARANQRPTVYVNA